MDNINKKYLKKFKKIRDMMLTNMSIAQNMLNDTLSDDSIIDNIAVIRVQISLLKSFEDTLVNFLGEAICQSRQPD